MPQIIALNNFPHLQQQLRKSWQQFSEQQPTSCRYLTTQQLIDFKQALALSDFVLQSALQCPDLVVELFSAASVNVNSVYQQELPDYEQLLKLALLDCKTEAELHQILRRFRRQQMVKIAVADLVLNAELEQSLLRLSTLADALIMAALAWLTDFCQQRWGHPQRHAQSQSSISKSAINKSAISDPMPTSMPMLVYGMGKLGGKELNFSSDIDLIFAYPHAGQTVGTRRSIDNQQYFTRLAQKLIAALHQVSADGFVYRVDMRLRPFGESGPLVLTFNAMEDYYQEQGRDWERYAMLKARLIGNSEYHGQLSKMLRPFVYRRYIDFSVIDSLRRMKMMVAQEVRRKHLTNNIKLGAGGIREIEFIVQVFQLIRGGRIKALQQRSLLTVLPILVEQQVITPKSGHILTNAYLFLRRVENIIQAIADQQSQTLPDNGLDQQRLLRVLNFASWADFLSQLESHMSAVHQEFKLLIGEDSPNHQAKDKQWQEFWHTFLQLQTQVTVATKAESIHCLTKLAPDWQAEKTFTDLHDFTLEVNRRGIGNRGVLVLDKLIPLLLWHLKQLNYEREVLTRVLIVLKKISSRTVYLELLYENEGALKQLCRLCQASAWLAEHIAKYPILLDELIDPKLLHNPPLLSSYGKDLRETMLRIPEDDLETQMDILRQFKQAQHLRIAAGDIVGVLPLVEVSDHLTALAEAIIDEVILLAWQQLVQRFGIPSSLLGKQHKGFAVIGYGKLGGYELSYSSDLDLVFVHDSKANDMTNGIKQVSASHFYAKLAQRIMHIFNSQMASGILYELDMRLRPSGNSGVLVVHIDTFAQYQLEDAWTWEHQALVRARAIYGHAQIIARFKRIRQQVLAQARDVNQLKDDVISMRNKMRSHLDHTTEQNFDLKQGRGGLVDIEFLVQYLVLRYCSAYSEIAQFSDNLRLLEQLSQAGVLTDEQQQLLSECYCQLRDFGHRATMQNKRLQPSDELISKVIKIAAIYQQFLTA